MWPSLRIGSESHYPKPNSDDLLTTGDKQQFTQTVNSWETSEVFRPSLAGFPYPICSSSLGEAYCSINGFSFPNLFQSCRQLTRVRFPSLPRSQFTSSRLRIQFTFRPGKLTVSLTGLSSSSHDSHPSVNPITDGEDSVSGGKELWLHNTMSRKNELFKPISARSKVKLECTSVVSLFTISEPHWTRTRLRHLRCSLEVSTWKKKA
ncbi:unnamed protein product [Microthlaspi erraticum]|uniref:Uncharacterized protein n=1 Tax=Microthlaspi erraticum TaxID=1685480 RepID=A0A6D2K7G8_9BRAS|nr:unnamed protein product [Microthlaspi erraticum]